MPNENSMQIFNSWYESVVDTEDDVSKLKLLSHYTSLEAFAKICETGELWFSSPLFMNDLQELRGGIFQGRAAFFDKVAEFDDKKRSALEYYFDKHLDAFDKNVLNIYIFCMSEHDEADVDGLLSMWRGYGGFGSGCAIVIDTKFISPKDHLPIYISKVNYMSDELLKQRYNYIVTSWLENLKETDLSQHYLWNGTHFLFYKIAMTALSIKHEGFREEKEWRLIYQKDHDKDALFSDKKTYIITKGGVKPKLRVPISPLDPEASWNMESIIQKIIIGPTASSPLAIATVKHMLDILGKSSLCDKVVSSSIPLRTRP